MIDIGDHHGKDVITNLPERKSNRIRRKRRKLIGREFRLDTQIYGFDVKNIMLDLGFDVNVIPKASWEVLGRPKLVYSPIQLRMANQYCIFLVGFLKDVGVNVVDVKNVTDFGVINIIGEKDPYPTILGVD